MDKRLLNAPDVLTSRSPSSYRRSYHLSEVPPLPEEEKHTLLENMEAEPTSGASE